MSKYTESELEENREIWCKALEMGKYLQTTGRLQTRNGFCCLGVACEVAEKHGINVKRDEGILIGGNLLAMPEVFEWLGLQDGRGEMEDGRSLTIMNDSERLSFKEIAEVIRSKPDGLFI